MKSKTASMKYVEANNYTTLALRPHREINYGVIHDMEWPERPTTAEDCASMFATTTREASAHTCHDNNSSVLCVKLHHVAWHAPGANHDGVGIEQAGVARQTREEWLDQFGRDMILGEVAPFLEEVCYRHKLPLVFRRAPSLHMGLRGITTHWEVSKAWKRSTHWDPGSHYPMDFLLDAVNEIRQERANPGKPIDVKQPPPTLRLGDGGWRVKQAQRLLNYAERELLGDDANQFVKTDGVFGPETKTSVQRFQRKMLKVARADGVIDDDVWRGLWQARYLKWEGD